MFAWDDLRFFLAVARGRTLASAAVQLGVDATTVGRRLDRLTETLGTSLFDIGPAGHSLTSRGETLLKHAEEAERAMRAAMGDADPRGAGKPGGTVRISMSEGFATWIVAPHLPAFIDAHPHIATEIVTTNGFLNPSKREADLAVMLARPVRGPLRTQKLTDYDLGLYAAPTFIERHGKPERVGDLKHSRIIGYISDFIYADELRYISEVDRDIIPRQTSSSINVQHAMCRAGLGIAVLPHFIGRQSPGLVPILPSEIQLRRSFWIIVHRDLAHLERIRTAIDWLKGTVQDARALLLE